jgi:hypothetical protein
MEGEARTAPEPQVEPESGRDPAKRADVVYCGGCNPHIDRTAVAAELPLDAPDIRPGATVHLSGCPRACASDHQLTGRPGHDGAHESGGTPPDDAPVVVIVAGELVDGVPTAAAELAPAVTRKLKE